MNYAWTAILDGSIPRAANPVFQHLLDTYVSETNKVASTWPIAALIAITGAMLGAIVPVLKAVRQDVTEALSYE